MHRAALAAGAAMIARPSAHGPMGVSNRLARMRQIVSPRLLRLGLNLWPPFIGAGIRVALVAADWRTVKVELAPRLRNRGWLGAHFGGSLYAMTDPFFALMVARNLPPDFLVWDKAGSIDFVAPGRGRVQAHLCVTQTDIDTIVKMTAGGDKHLHLFKVDVVDAEGLVVARAEKIVYVRRQRSTEASVVRGSSGPAGGGPA